MERVKRPFTNDLNPVVQSRWWEKCDHLYSFFPGFYLSFAIVLDVSSMGPKSASYSYRCCQSPVWRLYTICTYDCKLQHLDSLSLAKSPPRMVKVVAEMSSQAVRCHSGWCKWSPSSPPRISISKLKSLKVSDTLGYLVVDYLCSWAGVSRPWIEVSFPVIHTFFMPEVLISRFYIQKAWARCVRWSWCRQLFWVCEQWTHYWLLHDAWEWNWRRSKGQ